MGLFGVILVPSGLILAITGIATAHEPAMLVGLGMTAVGALCFK